MLQADDSRVVRNLAVTIGLLVATGVGLAIFSSVFGSYLV